MQGSILNVGSDRSLILGDEGARYAFASSDWRSVDAKPEVGMRVDFETRGSDATDVYPLPITAARRVTYTDPTAKVSPPTEPTRKKPRLGKLLFVDKTIVVGMTVAILGMVLSAALLVYMLLNVEVPQVVRLVALVPSPGTVVLGDVGDTADLTVQGYYSDLSLEDLDPERISFESTDPSIVSVTADGTVTALAQGAADIVIRLGSTTERVHALIFGDIPTLPPIDPAMVGPIPDPELEIEVRAVLNRVIIELHSRFGLDRANEIAEELGGEVIHSYRSFPGFVIEFDAETNALMDVIQGLEGDNTVEAAYPDVTFEPSTHPIDTLLASASGDRICAFRDPANGKRYNPSVGVEAQLNAAYLQAGFEGAWGMMHDIPALQPVFVSVNEADGVVNLEYPNQHQILAREFSVDRIYTPSNLTETEYHAAAVTSIVAANNQQFGEGLENAENFSGIVASVDGLDYYVISFHSPSASAELMILEQLQSINAGGNAVDVINMSLGHPQSYLRRHTTKIREAMASMDDVVFVSSAGNDRSDATDRDIVNALSLDQRLDNMMVVGGANCLYDDRHTSSNFGKAVTIAAPGERILAIDTRRESGYGLVNGTSFAAPMVTGAVALLRSIDPGLNPGEIKDYLVETADTKDVCTTGNDPCADGEEEEWHFLRADKAVAQLIRDRVNADVGQRVIVPVDNDRIEGFYMDVGVYIHNEGEIVWPFHVEAWVAEPDGQQKEWELNSEFVAIAPETSHPFTGTIHGDQPGCWDLRIRVSLDDPNNTDSHLQITLAELANSPGNHGLLADTGWIKEAIEVRPAGAPDIALGCSGAANAAPLTLRDSTGQSQTGPGYNVLLLADTSGSMDGSKVTALKEAVRIFVNRARDIQVEAKAGSAPNPNLIGMVDFDSGYREVLSMQAIEPSDGSLSQWQSAIRSLDADGGTALYDAVIRSVQLLESEGVPGKGNILIALTDGSDQDSSNSLRAAVEAVAGSSVTMYAVALSEPGGAGDYDFSVLEDMARAGRGSAFAAHTDNLDSVYELFTTIFAIQ